MRVRPQPSDVSQSSVTVVPLGLLQEVITALIPTKPTTSTTVLLLVLLCTRSTNTIKYYSINIKWGEKLKNYKPSAVENKHRRTQTVPTIHRNIVISLHRLSG